MLLWFLHGRMGAGMLQTFLFCLFDPLCLRLSNNCFWFVARNPVNSIIPVLFQPTGTGEVNAIIMHDA